MQLRIIVSEKKANKRITYFNISTKHAVGSALIIVRVLFGAHKRFHAFIVFLKKSCACDI